MTAIEKEIAIFAVNKSKIMDFKKINAPTSTVTYDRDKIDSQSEKYLQSNINNF